MMLCIMISTHARIRFGYYVYLCKFKDTHRYWFYFLENPDLVGDEAGLFSAQVFVLLAGPPLPASAQLHARSTWPQPPALLLLRL